MPTIRTALFCITLCTTLSAFAQMGPSENQGFGSGGQNGQGGMRPGNGQMRGPQMLQQADTNDDHKVSREEFLAQAAKHFAQMDRNGDGYLTRDDRPSNEQGGGQGGPGGEQSPPQQ